MKLTYIYLFKILYSSFSKLEKAIAQFESIMKIIPEFHCQQPYFAFLLAVLFENINYHLKFSSST